MGLFDEIKVAKKLPLPKHLTDLLGKDFFKNHTFQTKDLDNVLDVYHLKKNGFLYKENIEREYVEFTKEEQEKRKKNKQFLPIHKEVIEKSRTYEKINFHGKINFYTYESLDEKEDFWIEFCAYFIYGKLDKIEFIKFQKEKSKKISYQEIIKDIQLSEKKPWNIFKKYASSYLGWRLFWESVCRFITFLDKKLNEIKYFIFRYFI